jgi:hypothetical protein
MKKAYFVFLLLTTINCFSQAERKLTTFALVQYNNTLYDQKPFNKNGIAGLGLQLFSNSKNLFKPTLEINADLFNEHGIGPADGPTEQKIVIPSVYIGPSFYPNERVFIAATVGSTLYGKARFGVRPSIGFYPCSTKRWFAKASYTNVFQEAKIQDKDFGYVSVALAFKLQQR